MDRTCRAHCNRHVRENGGWDGPYTSAAIAGALPSQPNYPPFSMYLFFTLRFRAFHNTEQDEAL